MAEDMETCSLCLDEVPDRTLKETDAGRTCPECRRENPDLR